MSRLALGGLLLLAGCRSTIDLESGGRAYECARDGGAPSQCPHDWRCGDDGRCFDPSLGVARRCETAQTGCGGGWKCGLEQRCFDPKKTDGPARACSDSTLHCYDGWRCGLDRICFDPSVGGTSDGGALRCTSAAAHCLDGHRCGLDGLCFDPVRSPDAGAGPGCTRDDQCAIGWRCGRESSGRRLCQPVGVGGPYVCQGDDDCEGWRCNPVELRCVDTREPVTAPPFAIADVVPRLLSPLPLPGEPVQVAATQGAQVNPGGRLNQSATFSVAGLLTSDAGLLITTWTNEGVRELATGEPFVAIRKRHLQPGNVLELAAGGANVFVLDDAGTVTEFDAWGAAGTPRPLPQQAVALRQSLSGLGELAAIVGPGNARELVTLAGEFADAGPIIRAGDFGCGLPSSPPLEPPVDVAWAQDGPFVRALILTRTGICFFSRDRFSGAAPTIGAQINFPSDAGVGVRLFTTFSGSREAFGPMPLVTTAVAEVATANGYRYHAFQISPWTSMGLPTISPSRNNMLAPACELCPGGVRPTEVVPLAAVPGMGSNTPLRVHCPAAVVDGGASPEASYNVTSRDSCGWALSRVFDADEARPHLEPVAVQQTAPSRRVLGGRNGQVWMTNRSPGTLAAGLLLDAVPDIAIRVAFGPGPKTLFFQAADRPYRYLPGIGAFTLGEQSSTERPVGSVVGQPGWAMSSLRVIDATRLAANSTSESLTIATAPAGVTWEPPVFAAEVDGQLFIGARDTVYVGNVTKQLTSNAEPPAQVFAALVPVPGLPLRGIAARRVSGLAFPELWVAAGDGIFRGTSADGTRWVTQRIALGAREGDSQLPWTDATGVRLLLVNGEVISLPTSVPLAPAPMPASRVLSALRACDATFVIMSGIDGGVFSLSASPPDGGLAPWAAVSGLPPSIDLSGAQLRRTEQELLLITRGGEVWDLTPPPMRDGGCP